MNKTATFGAGCFWGVEAAFRRLISYEELLDVFGSSHDPTTLNRQGHDVGTQYRSVIFVHDDAQHATSETSKAALEASGRYRRPVVTAVEPAALFWPAEDYHQRYLEKRGLASCTLELASPGSPRRG